MQSVLECSGHFFRNDFSSQQRVEIAFKVDKSTIQREELFIDQQFGCFIMGVSQGSPLIQVNFDQGASVLAHWRSPLDSYIPISGECKEKTSRDPHCY
jgi:hypothetical protein